MRNETYDIIKLMALITVPAITFITAVINIWGIPHGTEIIATLTALDTLIGAIVAILSAQYHKKQEAEAAVEEGAEDEGS